MSEKLQGAIVKKVTSVAKRMQTRFVRITKHPLEVEERQDGVVITIHESGKGVPELSMLVAEGSTGLVMKVDVLPNDTGAHDIMLAFADKLKLSFPEEDDFPQVEMRLEPGKFYEFTVLTKPITGGLGTTWEQAHARRLIEAAMLACWSPLEAVRAILVPGLFRKMPVVKRIMFADGESGN
jgi:hypothetical protein